MRTFDEKGKETLLNELGEIDALETTKVVLSAFNIQDPRTLTSEKVFYNTHRLVADSHFFKAPEQQSLFNDRLNLTKITAPVVEFLTPKFPNCTPVLVQIATLPPHTELLYHVDCYLYQNESHKVHVPLFTNPEALYQTIDEHDDERRDFHFRVGQVYEINNILYHRSVNRGDAPRTHLIIDFMNNSAIEYFENRSIDFFFTHHRKNKVLEFKAAERMMRKANGSR